MRENFPGRSFLWMLRDEDLSKCQCVSEVWVHGGCPGHVLCTILVSTQPRQNLTPEVVLVWGVCVLFGLVFFCGGVLFCFLLPSQRRH